jgi:hypothetical protein
MAKTKYPHVLSLRFDDETKSLIRKIAAERKMSEMALIRHAVDLYIRGESEMAQAKVLFQSELDTLTQDVARIKQLTMSAVAGISIHSARMQPRNQGESDEDYDRRKRQYIHSAIEDSIKVGEELVRESKR